MICHLSNYSILTDLYLGKLSKYKHKIKRRGILIILHKPNEILFDKTEGI